MFDFRYHALSLVAVLVALAVGLLLGVAIGDRGLVSDAKTDIEGDLLARARSDADDLRAELRRRNAFEEQAYPALVSDKLFGERFALVFLGGRSGAIVDQVGEALEGSGGELGYVGVVREPVDLGRLGEAAEGTRYASLEADPDLLDPFARAVGGGLVRGGRLAREARDALFSSFQGDLRRVDGVIVARLGGREEDEEGAEEVAALEEGLVSGMEARDVPVVGVETLDADPSQVPWYQDRDIASVDDLDQIAGRAALVFALTGQADGAYGVKETAEAVLPTVVSGVVTSP